MNVDMTEYKVYEDAPIPEDESIEDYEVVSDDDGHGVELEDPTEIIEPTRKKRRIRKK